MRSYVSRVKSILKLIVKIINIYTLLPRVRNIIEFAKSSETNRNLRKILLFKRTGKMWKRLKLDSSHRDKRKRLLRHLILCHAGKNRDVMRLRYCRAKLISHIWLWSVAFSQIYLRNFSSIIIRDYKDIGEKNDKQLLKHVHLNFATLETITEVCLIRKFSFEPFCLRSIYRHFFLLFFFFDCSHQRWKMYSPDQVFMYCKYFYYPSKESVSNPL